jgi:hypothetical protein
LRFYGPSALKEKTPAVIVVLFPEADCSKCISSTESVRTLVRDRLATRGITPIWTTPTDLGLAASSASNADVEDAASRYADVKKTSGSLVVRWGIAPSDEVDAAHADETRYSVFASLRLRSLPVHKGSLELLEAEAFDRSVGKLLTDAFTDLGAKVSVGDASGVLSGASGAERPEALLVVKFQGPGNWTYDQYSKMRDSLTEGLSAFGEMAEREVARGRAVFVLYSSAQLSAVSDRVLATRLEGFTLSPLALSPGQTEGHTLEFDAKGSQQ